MGFFTHGTFGLVAPTVTRVAIPFRVGWGFSPCPKANAWYRIGLSVAIPFRVGWGFSPNGLAQWGETATFCRNPFQGGMGFFTHSFQGISSTSNVGSQSLSGWDGVFHKVWLITYNWDADLSRNPFQGGMGFFTKTSLSL